MAEKGITFMGWPKVPEFQNQDTGPVPLLPGPERCHGYQDARGQSAVPLIGDLGTLCIFCVLSFLISETGMPTGHDANWT